MGQPNPFDFSDFGPPRHPSGPTPSPAGPSGGPPSAAESGFASGFDPWANQSKTPQRSGQQDLGGQDAFGNSVAPGALGGGALATAGPPLKWFAIALLLALAGVVLALVSVTSGGGVLLPALAGWLLAGPVAIGALAVYTRVDTRRRSESIYSAPRWATRLYWLVLTVCLIGIVVGAWQIALWAGRQ